MNKYKYPYIDDDQLGDAEYSSTKPLRSSFILNMATNAILKPKPIMTSDMPEKLLIECPNCDGYFGVITPKAHTEVPCPHCGILGFVNG
jgi:ribosomal protein S27E